IVVVEFSRRKKMHINWWQWLITVLGFCYTGFVLKMITSFLHEGSPQASLVMGLIFGFLAIVWGVLLGRFVFKTKKN
ncbi:hypothetical protein ACFLRR_04435, partial [Bacteroidota bacterium]